MSRYMTGLRRVRRGCVCPQVFVLLTSGCVLLPLVSIPTFHKLRFVSLLSVGSMVYVTFVVVFRGAVRQRESFAELKPPQPLTPAKTNPAETTLPC